jgi:hypothetical protein
MMFPFPGVCSVFRRPAHSLSGFCSGPIFVRLEWKLPSDCGDNWERVVLFRTLAIYPRIFCKHLNKRGFSPSSHPQLWLEVRGRRANMAILT